MKKSVLMTLICFGLVCPPLGTNNGIAWAASKKKKSSTKTSWTLPVVGLGLVAFGIFKIFSDKKKQKEANQSPTPTPTAETFSPKHPLPDLDFSQVDTSDGTDTTSDEATGAQAEPFDSAEPDAFMQCMMGVLNKKDNLEDMPHYASLNFLRFVSFIEKEMGCKVGSSSAASIDISSLKDNSAPTKTKAQELATKIENEIKASPETALLKAHTETEDVKNSCVNLPTLAFLKDSKDPQYEDVKLFSPNINKINMWQNEQASSSLYSMVLVDVDGNSETIESPANISKCYSFNPKVLSECIKNNPQFEKHGCKNYLKAKATEAQESPGATPASPAPHGNGGI